MSRYVEIMVLLQLKLVRQSKSGNCPSHPNVPCSGMSNSEMSVSLGDPPITLSLSCLAFQGLSSHSSSALFSKEAEMKHPDNSQCVIASERSQCGLESATLLNLLGSSPLYAPLLFAMVIMVSGCVNVMRPASPASHEELRIETDHPEQFEVMLREGRTCSVPPGGRVVIELPALAHGCTTYLFGVVKVADPSSRNTPIVRVVKNGNTRWTLSLSQLTSLTVDPDGYFVLRDP